jgi:hydrogenase maturation protease
MIDQNPILIVGAGNEYRSDDGVGPVIVKKLGQLLHEKATIRKCIKDGTELIELCKGHKCVYLVDSVKSGCEPGKIFRFDANSEALPREAFSCYSTHAFNVAESIELARSMGCLPEKMIVYGIEGKCFEDGENFSDEVKRSIAEVIIRIKREIDEF